MPAGFHAGVTDADLRYALAPLRDLDKRIRNRALRRVAAGAGREQRDVLRLLIPKNSGSTRRATAQKVKQYKGVAVSISGQKKGKKYKKTRVKPHSGLGGQGYPVPLWFLDARVRPHRIPGRINRFGIQTRGTKGGRGIRNVKPMTLPGGFAWRVKHPGMPNRGLLTKAELASFKRALRAAINIATVEVQLEAQAARQAKRMQEWD